MGSSSTKTEAPKAKAVENIITSGGFNIQLIHMPTMVGVLLTIVTVVAIVWSIISIVKRCRQRRAAMEHQLLTRNLNHHQMITWAEAGQRREPWANPQFIQHVPMEYPRALDQDRRGRLTNLTNINSEAATAPPAPTAADRTDRIDTHATYRSAA